MHPTHFLRLEGLAVGAAALAAYVLLGGPLWLLVVLALAPDLSMIAYAAGPRLGSLGYNVAHAYALPLGLAGLGLWIDAVLALQVAAVWIAHIGIDRLAGYGMKYETGFEHTHLLPLPSPDDHAAEGTPVGTSTD